MRVGIVNNHKSNTTYSYMPSIPAFQARIPVSKEEKIARAVRLTNSSSTNPNKLREALKDMIEMAKNRDFLIGEVSEAQFKYKFDRVKGSITKGLKSENIIKQKEAIDKLFKLCEGNTHQAAEEYIFNKLVPHIVETKNKELADYILKSKNKTIANGYGNYPLIERRVKLIKELGSNEYLTYEVPNYLHGDSEYKDTLRMRYPHVEKAIQETINKLETNPNF